jgi:hypothetical protein
MFRSSLRLLILVLLFNPSVSLAQQLTVGTFLQNELYQYTGPIGPAPGTVIAGPAQGAFGIAGLTQQQHSSSFYFSAQLGEAVYKYTPGTGVSPVVLSSTLHELANPGQPMGTNSYGPGGIAMGSDGLIYVTRSGGFGAPNPGTGTVDRFNVVTGEYAGTLVSGLTGTVGVTASGNDLYVTNRLSALPAPPYFAQGNVLKISNYTSANPTVTDLIPSGTSSLAFPVSSAIGPDGRLYVVDVGDEGGNAGPAFPGSIHRFNLTGGSAVEDLAFLTFLPGRSPSGLFFREDGSLLLANLGTSYGPAISGQPFNGSVELYNVSGAAPILLSTIDSGLMASSVIVAAVPEPGQLLLGGLMVVRGLRRRR